MTDYIWNLFGYNNTVEIEDNFDDWIDVGKKQKHSKPKPKLSIISDKQTYNSFILSEWIYWTIYQLQNIKYKWTSSRFS